MKISPYLLLITLILTSCSIDWKDEKSEKIIKLEKQIQEDTFNKKMNCSKYKMELAELYSNNKDYMFMSIFYSPKNNSCLYHLLRKSSNSPNNLIYDYLTGKEVTFKDDSCALNDNQCIRQREIFNDILNGVN